MKAAIAGAMMVWLAGCASAPQLAHDCPSSVPEALRKIDVNALADGLVAELCSAPVLPDDDVVLVPDLVDLKSFTPGMTGMVLGEVVRAKVSARCKVRIRQIEVGKTLRVNEGGMSLLTREARELPGEVAARHAFVGTYSMMPNKLIVTLRDVDVREGTAARIASREVSFGCRAGWAGSRFEVAVR